MAGRRCWSFRKTPLSKRIYDSTAKRYF